MHMIFNLYYPSRARDAEIKLHSTFLRYQEPPSLVANLFLIEFFQLQNIFNVI